MYQILKSKINSHFSKFVLIIILIMTSNIHANESVILSGKVQIYKDDVHVECRDYIGTNIRFVVVDSNVLRFDNANTLMKSYCGWNNRGSINNNSSSDVLINVSIDGFVYFHDGENKPRKVQIHSRTPRVNDIYVVLKTPNRASDDAFFIGKNLLPRIDEITPADADNNNIIKAIDWIKRSEEYKKHPVRLAFKGHLYHALDNYEYCVDAFTEAISHLTPSDTTIRQKYLLEKLNCLYKIAQLSNDASDWRNIQDICDSELSPEINYKVNQYKRLCFDSLLIISESRNDFRVFANAVVSDSDLKQSWIHLFYNVHEGRDPPDNINANIEFDNAVALSHDLN